MTNYSSADEKLIDDGKVMSLLSHLGELRERAVKALFIIMGFFFVAIFFSEEVIRFLERPLLAVMKSGENSLHFTGPLDVFLVSIKVSFFTSLVCSSPFWIYQFWKFIEPALYESERRYILPFVFASTLLFVSGLCFSYFGILPIALEFLLDLGRKVGTPIITVTDYTSMLILMLFGFAFVFEAPLILVLLASLDLIQSKTLCEYRRFVCVGVLIVGAILTPPDPLSQVGMAVPLYFMYEASIIIIRFMEKKRAKSA